MTENTKNSPEHDSTQLRQEIAELDERMLSLQMATLDQDGTPCISYTPFYKADSVYYIFVSQLATHTQNLMAHQKLSILIIDDEENSKNVFARKRLNLKCIAEEVVGDDNLKEEILDAFEARQGNTMKLLRTLSDFHLFKLIPESGTFVKGFGQAFELTGEELATINHIRPE